jgi:hypothetical protein
MKADIPTLRKPDILTLQRHTFPSEARRREMSVFFDLSISATRHPAHRAARLNFYNSVGAEQAGTPGTVYFAECTKVWRGLMVRLQAAAEGKGTGPFFSQDGLAS